MFVLSPIGCHLSFFFPSVLPGERSSIKTYYKRLVIWKTDLAWKLLIPIHQLLSSPAAERFYAAK